MKTRPGHLPVIYPPVSPFFRAGRPAGGFYVLGIDVTSRPSAKKPLVIASGRLSRGRLVIRRVLRCHSYAGFEAVLSAPGPWVAGIDAPLSFPSGFLAHLGVSGWRECCEALSQMGREGFISAVYQYRSTLKEGQKLPLRECDRLAGAKSPLLLAYVPVGKMAFEVMTRLHRAPCTVIPFETPGPRPGVVVETYPALLTRRFITGRRYKHDDPRKHTPAHTLARRDLLEALSGRSVRELLGFSVHLSRGAARACLSDWRGDAVDAVLCAATAAWSRSFWRSGWGVPAAADRAEGWVVSPEFLIGAATDR